MSKLKEQGHDEYSLRARVYAQIEDDILNGVYKAGDNLIETKISEDLGVSRTPVREAIRQLELEGLVQSIPNKGAVVNGITEKDIDDIYEIRTLIEGLAAKWAAEKITPEEMAELEETIELESFYTGRNDIENLLELDSRLHRIIFKASKSNPLNYMLQHFHNYIKKARNMSLAVPGRPAEALKEHRAIVDAIKAGDGKLAGKQAVEHIRNARQNIKI
jgi:DNA-binding GntR family transcriptional regulator